MYPKIKPGIAIKIETQNIPIVSTIFLGFRANHIASGIEPINETITVKPAIANEIPILVNNIGLINAPSEIDVPKLNDSVFLINSNQSIKKFPLIIAPVLELSFLLWARYKRTNTSEIAIINIRNDSIRRNINLKYLFIYFSFARYDI
ncbi:MAG: hypothetical protein DSZ21_00325 [Tenericutes bacterium]|nr:MAG: hypothetical protein DSZ21_00325 [Mycoplasmatota bacterium]